MVKIYKIIRNGVEYIVIDRDGKLRLYRKRKLEGNDEEKNSC